MDIMFNCFFTFISQPWVLTPVMSGLITLSLLLFFNFEFRRTFNRFISNYFYSFMFNFYRIWTSTFKQLSYT
jgi:hypothetical protein